MQDLKKNYHLSQEVIGGYLSTKMKKLKQKWGKHRKWDPTQEKGKKNFQDKG